MNEWAKEHGRPDDRIDLMLAHIPMNKVEGAYNRAAYMPRRRELACIWANMLTPGLVAPISLTTLPCKESHSNATKSSARQVALPCVSFAEGSRELSRVDKYGLLRTTMEREGFERWSITGQI